MSTKQFTQQSVPPEYACLIVRARMPAEISEINKIKQAINKAEIGMTVSEVEAAFAAAGLIAISGMITGIATIGAGLLVMGGGAGMLKSSAGKKVGLSTFDKQIANKEAKLGAKASLKKMGNKAKGSTNKALDDLDSEGVPGEENGLAGELQAEDISTSNTEDEKTKKEIEDLKRDRDRMQEKFSMQHTHAQSVAQNSQVITQGPSQIGSSSADASKKRQEALEQQSQGNERALQSADGAGDKTVDSVLRANYMPPLMRRA